MIKTVIIASVVGCALLLGGCNSLVIGQPTTTTKTYKRLTDITWQQILPAELTSMAPDASRSLLKNRPSIRFSSTDQRFSGSDGCNRIMGSYQADDSHLQLGQIASTMMACLSGNEAMSRRFTDALSQVSAYRIQGHTLILMDSHHATLLMFKASHD